MFLGTSCTKVETISKGPMVPQMQNYPSATIGEYRLRGGNVVLRSNLINLPEEAEEEKKKSLKQMSQILNSKGITAYVRSYITNTQSIRTLTFDEDCKLDVTLDIPYPMFVYVSQIGEIYMCPGDTAYVNLDLAAKSREEQKLRGRGVLGALAAGAVLGTAAALGAGIRRPYYRYGYPYRYGYGYGRPFMRPMFRPFIF